MRQNKKNKGFTLVELLIVVAIIGILAAVLTPQFLNARKVAADRAAEAYAHNVYTAVQATIAQDGLINLTSTLANCSNGWNTGGDYAVPKPSESSGFKIQSCTVNNDGDGVTVTYQGGSEPTEGVSTVTAGEEAASTTP